MKMKEERIGLEALDADIPERRRRGRPNQKCNDALDVCHVTKAGLKEGNITNMASREMNTNSDTGEPR